MDGHFRRGDTMAKLTGTTIERPPQERLNKLPDWANGYIRDLEFEIEWMLRSKAANVKREVDHGRDHEKR